MVGREGHSANKNPVLPVDQLARPEWFTWPTSWVVNEITQPGSVNAQLLIRSWHSLLNERIACPTNRLANNFSWPESCCSETSFNVAGCDWPTYFLVKHLSWLSDLSTQPYVRLHEPWARTGSLMVEDWTRHNNVGRARQDPVNFWRIWLSKCIHTNIFCLEIVYIRSTKLQSLVLRAQINMG